MAGDIHTALNRFTSRGMPHSVLRRKPPLLQFGGEKGAKRFGRCFLFRAER